MANDRDDSLTASDPADAGRWRADATGLKAYRPSPPATLPFRPTAIQALTVSFEPPGGEPCTALVRRWEPGAASRCRLCLDCTAKVGPDGHAVCVVAVHGDAPEGVQALLYSPDGLNRPFCDLAHSDL